VLRWLGNGFPKVTKGERSVGLDTSATRSAPIICGTRWLSRDLCVVPEALRFGGAWFKTRSKVQVYASQRSALARKRTLSRTEVIAGEVAPYPASHSGLRYDRLQFNPFAETAN